LFFSLINFAARRKNDPSYFSQNEFEDEYKRNVMTKWEKLRDQLTWNNVGAEKRATIGILL
jgi:hypothetical protein